MPDSDNSRVQIWVAIIGLVSAIGVAVIANWDKIFPKKPSSVSASSSSSAPPKDKNQKTDSGNAKNDSASDTKSSGTGSKTDSGETASGTNDLMAGSWTNDNPQTHGITRLEIVQNGMSVRVHAWAAPKFGPDWGSATSPTGGGKGALVGMLAGSGKTDWGIQSGTINAGSATVSWNQESVVRNMTITPDGKRLRVVVDNVYKSNSPPRQLQEYFVKSP